MKTDEMMYNWRNDLRSHEKGARLVAASTARELSQKGYSASEALDMLLSDNFDIRIAEDAVRGVFASDASAPAAATIQVPVVPTRYSDVKPIVEASLARLSSKMFVDALALSESPLLPRQSKASLESWYKLADRAKADEYGMELLHAELRPYIEEAMYQSVLLAESGKGNNARLAGSQGEGHTVSVETGTCDCARFTRGRFAQFGIACEHLVTLADRVSPYERIARAISA